MFIANVQRFADVVLAMTRFVESLTLETLYNNNSSLYATSIFS
jgi:hypothetical protein